MFYRLSPNINKLGFKLLELQKIHFLLYIGVWYIWLMLKPDYSLKVSRLNTLIGSRKFPFKQQYKNLSSTNDY